FYTKITYFYDVKFQNLNGNFYKITRLNNPILEQNQEEKISKKDYEKARKKLIEKSIKKKRYEFELCSFKSFIDVYEDLNLYVLKVFFPTLEMANLFTPPKEFRIQRELCGV
ncbi:CYTH domain-containing protein, partial [Campylobacter coli]